MSRFGRHETLLTIRESRLVNNCFGLQRFVGWLTRFPSPNIASARCCLAHSQVEGLTCIYCSMGGALRTEDIVSQMAASPRVCELSPEAHSRSNPVVSNCTIHPWSPSEDRVTFTALDYRPSEPPPTPHPGRSAGTPPTSATPRWSRCRAGCTPSRSSTCPNNRTTKRLRVRRGRAGSGASAEARSGSTRGRT